MEMPLNFCRRRDLVLLCVLALTLFVWVQVHSLGIHPVSLPRPAWSSSLHHGKEAAEASRPMWRDDHGIEVERGFKANSTLNFGGILAVSTRTSKRRAALALSAELTGLSISVPDQPVWTDDDVSEFKSKQHSVISKGSAMSWLGHLNAIKHFLEQGWETALIMEDDVNWDIHLRGQQIPLFARALHVVVEREVRERGSIVHPNDRESKTRSTSNQSPVKAANVEFRSKARNDQQSSAPRHHRRPSSFWPDSKHWDLLYLGHCGDFFPAAKLPNIAHSIYPDASLSSFEGLHADTQRFIHPLPVPSKHRMVHQSIRPLCTFAYAITRAAAQRMLADLAHEGAQGTFAYDVRILELCRQGTYKCWSANPELIHHVDDTASEISKINNGASAIPEAIPQTEAEREAIEAARPRDVDRARAKARGTPNVACGIRTLVEKMGAGRGVRTMVKAAMGMDGVCPMPLEEVDLLKGQIFERGRTDIPI